MVGSKTLNSMRGIEHFKNLTVINLSGNKIEKIEGLKNLGNLRDINLSTNSLR